VKHSFIKKVTKTPDKTVSFVSSENPAVKVTKKTEVTSVTTVPNKSPSKAAAAGKQTRTLKEKRVYEEKVSDGEYERRMAEMRKDKEGPPAKGSTRSGRTFKN
jgi:flagellar hook assembly protein FlgD